MSRIGFLVSGLGYQVSGFGCQVSCIGFQFSGFGHWISVLGSRVLGFGYRISGTTLDSATSCQFRQFEPLTTSEVGGIDFWRQFPCKFMELTFAIASRQLWGGWGGPKVVSLGDQVADARLETRAWRRALRANVAHIRRTSPDSGIAFHAEGMETLQVVSISLESGPCTPPTKTADGCCCPCGRV